MSQMKKTLTNVKSRKADTGVVVSRADGNEVAMETGQGIVSICVFGALGGGKGFGVSKLIESLKAGLPVRELDELRSNLDLPMERLVPMLGISKATLHRRKNSGRLDAAESDRVVRFARLLGRAAAVMETLDDGRRWLTSPQVGLGGAIPLEYAETEVGAREVENLLGRIEYGVYS
jgi:putative toxin-antitoxin system antitoxin component (TIGR02293 family)